MLLLGCPGRQHHPLCSGGIKRAKWGSPACSKTSGSSALSSQGPGAAAGQLCAPVSPKLWEQCPALYPGEQQVLSPGQGRESSGWDLRQGFVVIDEVGHPEEFLDCFHHFGRFCSEQLAVQDKNLRGRRQGCEVSTSRWLPALLSWGITTPLLSVLPPQSQICHESAQPPLLNAKGEHVQVFTYLGCWKIKRK